ncbi:hypothetical protein P9112_005823 [Eukaryota sp. TZLM1-RC]
MQPIQNTGNIQTRSRFENEQPSLVGIMNMLKFHWQYAMPGKTLQKQLRSGELPNATNNHCGGRGGGCPFSQNLGDPNSNFQNLNQKSGVNKFCCFVSLCPRTEPFSKRSELTRHLKKMHPDVSTDILKNNGYMRCSCTDIISVEGIGMHVTRKGCSIPVSDLLDNSESSPLPSEDSPIQMYHQPINPSQRYGLVFGYQQGPLVAEPDSYGHVGHYRNQMADKLANIGALGNTSPNMKQLTPSKLSQRRPPKPISIMNPITFSQVGNVPDSCSKNICSFCDDDFERSRDLCSHLKENHSALTQDELLLNQFCRCPCCQNIFTTRGFDIHWNSQHQVPQEHLIPEISDNTMIELTRRFGSLNYTRLKSKVSWKYAIDYISNNTTISQEQKCRYLLLLPILFHSEGSIESSCGVKQGDPLGPYVFAEGLDDIMSKMSSEFPDAMSLGYLNNEAVLCTSKEQCTNFLGLLSKLSAPVGCNVNREKYEIVQLSNNTPFDILGCPIGSLSPNQSDLKVKELEKCLVSLEKLPLQYRLLLLRMCIQPKLGFLARAWTPDLANSLLEKFHELVCNCIKNWFKTEVLFDGLVSLPMNWVGLGMTD